MLGKEPLTSANDSETRETVENLPPPHFDAAAIKHARPAVPLAKVEARTWPTKVLIIAAVLAALIGGAVGRSLPALFHRNVAPQSQATQTQSAKAPAPNPQEDSPSTISASENQQAANRSNATVAQNQPVTQKAEASNKEAARALSRSELKPAADDSKQSVVPDGETDASLRDALNGWVAATNERDINKQMSFYPQTLKAFYLSRNTSRADVRAEKARVFSHAASVDIRTGVPQIKLSPDGRTATMRFRKRYQIAGGGEDRTGEVLQELRWQKVNGQWRITSERDLKVVQ